MGGCVGANSTASNSVVVFARCLFCLFVCFCVMVGIQSYVHFLNVRSVLVFVVRSVDGRGPLSSGSCHDQVSRRNARTVGQDCHGDRPLTGRGTL